MKSYVNYLILLSSILLTSCRSIVSKPGKPLIEDSIQIDKVYEIQNFNAKVLNVRITGFDKEFIYGISSKNEKIVIEKSDIRQMKKWKMLNSALVCVLAIAAVIFIPI